MSSFPRPAVCAIDRADPLESGDGSRRSLHYFRFHGSASRTRARASFARRGCLARATLRTAFLFVAVSKRHCSRDDINR